MPINNISDWLALLNERITSFEASLNAYLTVVFVILGFVLTMIGITVTTAKGMPLFFFGGQIVCIAGLIFVGIAMAIHWNRERSSPDRRYQQALRIRRRIMSGNLINADNIYQECIRTGILVEGQQ